VNLIQVNSKTFRKFENVSLDDESILAQKSFNVARLFVELSKMLNELKIDKSIPWYPIDGSVVGGGYYQQHIRDKGLFRPLNKLLDDFNRGVISTNVLHERASGELSTSDLSSEVLELLHMEWERLRIGKPNSTLVTRSANRVREDVAMQNAASAEEFLALSELVGAGKHSTYAFHDTFEKFVIGFLGVWASTFSYAACDDFRSLRIGDEWLHLICEMDVILMEQVHSQKFASFIGFGNVLGTGFNLSVFPQMYGEEGVSGAANPVEVQLNGNLLGSNAAVMSKSESLQMPDEWLESIGRVMNHIQNAKGYCPDIEGACGTLDPTLDPNLDNLVLSLTQERANLPVEIVKKSPFLSQDNVIRYPNAPLLFTGVPHSNYKCGVGELVKINEESEIRTVNPKGKILVTQESFPTLTGTKKQGLAGSVCFFGGLTCHWAIQTKGLIPYVTSSVQLEENIPWGQKATILKDRVYLGEHRDCWETINIDLRVVQLPKSIVPKLVFGDPLSIDQIYPLFKWGLVKDFALCRWEEIFWSLDLPCILDWLNYDKIDLKTKEGQISKTKIKQVMDSYGINNPKEAYICRFIAGVLPLAELCKQFGGQFDLRGYGARPDEDKSNLVEGVVPFPEPNPQYGYNGVPMYLTNWGSEVFDVIIEVLKRLYALGYTNIPLFLPNLCTPEELEILLQRAVNLGFDLTNVKVKPMLENLEAYYNVGRFIEVIKKFSAIPDFSFSGGWNDTTQNGKGIASRVLPVLAGGRSSSDNETWEEIAYDSVVRTVRYGGKFESCGVASPAIMRGMFRGKASACGLPGGKDFIDGLALFCDLEKEQNS
jgi:hypothetical protein